MNYNNCGKSSDRNSADSQQSPGVHQNDYRELIVYENHIPYILNGDFFTITERDGVNVKVRCNHCEPEREYRGSVRSTGNFHMHIKRKHPQLVHKLMEMRMESIQEKRKRELLMKQRSQTKLRNPLRRRRNPYIKKETTDNEQMADVPTNYEGQLMQPNSNANEEHVSAFQNNPVQNTAAKVCVKKEVPPLSYLEMPLDLTRVRNMLQENVQNAGKPEGATAVQANPAQEKAGSSPGAGGIKREMPRIIETPLDLTMDTSQQSAKRQEADESATVENPTFSGDPAEQALQKISETLMELFQEIRNDMQRRRELETYNLSYRVAKFRFLHPGFTFPNL